MAGGGDAADNPVAINVVPMVDVIFCLCVFFMCSMKFKQVEGKFDAWLPKDLGFGASAHEPAEIRVALFWDATSGVVRREFGRRMVGDDAELEALIQGEHQDLASRSRPEAPVIIDADGRVPWKDVIGVVDICKKLRIDNIEFALGKQN
jgi:biopolymer transport protein ExbD